MHFAEKFSYEGQKPLFEKTVGAGAWRLRHLFFSLQVVYVFRVTATTFARSWFMISTVKCVSWFLPVS